MDEPWAPSSEVDMSKAFDLLRRSQRFTLLMGMVALLTLGFVVTRPPSALAATLRPQTCTYYSDASYSVVVGHAALRCNGSIAQQSGTITAYRICQSDYCCGTVWC
jgi:hypothetical protein